MVDTVKANEGVVSTIGDTDLVMVCATGGGLKPISFANLMAAVRGEIQIGGRNLLSMPKDTSNARVSISNGVVTMIANADTYFNIPYANPDLMVVGETYTLSFDCEGMKEGNRWTMNGAQGSSQFNIELKNGHCAATFVLNDKQFKEGSTSFGFDDGVRSFPNGFSPVKLSNFKLERGNIATDWTPAPEDIASGAWGGVIGLYTINYNSVEKGGAHESRLYDLNCAPEGGADSHLSFRSLDALCEWLGRACEDGCDILDSEFRYNQGFGSGVADRVLSGRISIDGNTAGKCEFRWIDLLDDSELDSEFGLQHSSLLPGNSRRNLSAELHKGYVHSLAQTRIRLADRKEVAYV